MVVSYQNETRCILLIQKGADCKLREADVECGKNEHVSGWMKDEKKVTFVVWFQVVQVCFCLISWAASIDLPPPAPSVAVDNVLVRLQ